MTAPLAPLASLAEPTLIHHLAARLADEGIRYCQWKGHWRAERWSSGKGDIDLLVAADEVDRFRSILAELKLKLILPPRHRQIPGVESHYGFDPNLRVLLHIHVHYRLILGDYYRTVYRLPLETQVLVSAVEGTVFRIPSPELEFLFFVLRWVQRFPGPTARSPRPSPTFRAELDYLEARVDRARLAQALSQHLPCIDLSFLDRSRELLRAPSWGWARLSLKRELSRRLTAHARRPPIGAVLEAAGEKARFALGRPRLRSRACLPEGGTVVALVGGDGAGKSTCAQELVGWLSPALSVMRAHLGRPPRSATTLIVGGILRIGRVGRSLLDRMRRDTGIRAAERLGVTTYLELMRHVCTARDRYKLYVEVRRFALAGGVAICERYPIPQNRALVGPCIARELGDVPAKGLLRSLHGREMWYYEQMVAPDLVIVLLVEPEVAVRRKITEPAEYVRRRARVIWETDWSATRAHVVDAGRPLTEVVAQLKALIWTKV